MNGEGLLELFIQEVISSLAEADQSNRNKRQRAKVAGHEIKQSLTTDRKAAWL